MSLFGTLVNYAVGYIAERAAAPEAGRHTQASWDQLHKTVNATRARFGLPPVMLYATSSDPKVPLSMVPIPQEKPMSLLGDIGRAIAPGVGGVIGGYFGSAAVGTQIGTLAQQYSAQRSMMQPVASAGMVQQTAFPALGAIAGAVGRIGGLAVGAVTLGARTVYRSASIYCRRHPAWCAQIGGTAAIAAMISDGRLPPIKRRRARGISPSEFRGFRKVHKVLSGFCAPRMRVRTKRR